MPTSTEDATAQPKIINIIPFVITLMLGGVMGTAVILAALSYIQIDKERNSSNVTHNTEKQNFTDVCDCFLTTVNISIPLAKENCSILYHTSEVLFSKKQLFLWATLIYSTVGIALSLIIVIIRRIKRYCREKNEANKVVGIALW